MAVPFCILTSNEWEFLLFHIFVSIWWCVCVLDFGHFYRCIAVSNFVSVCSSLITYGVKHLFICLFSICGSLVSCLFRSLLFLKLNCSFIYGWVFRVSLDILDNSPLSDMSSVKIFSQSVICLLILLRLYTFHQIKMQREIWSTIQNIY